MLVTSRRLPHSRKILRFFVRVCLTRLRVEHRIRLVEQSYDVEDMRMMTYEHLRDWRLWSWPHASSPGCVGGTNQSPRCRHFTRSMQPTESSTSLAFATVPSLRGSERLSAKQCKVQSNEEQTKRAIPPQTLAFVRLISSLDSCIFSVDSVFWARNNIN